MQTRRARRVELRWIFLALLGATNGQFEEGQVRPTPDSSTSADGLDVNCLGRWSPCSSACEAAPQRAFIITMPPEVQHPRQRRHCRRPAVEPLTAACTSAAEWGAVPSAGGRRGLHAWGHLRNAGRVLRRLLHLRQRGSHVQPAFVPRCRVC
jgi:hypothetical protein